MDTQITINICIILLLAGLFTLVRAFPHTRSDISTAELKRRIKKDDETAKLLLKRNQQLVDINTLRFLLQLIIVIGLTTFCVWRLGVGFGVLTVFMVTIFAHVFASSTFIRNWLEKIYRKYDETITQSIKKLQPALKLLYGEYGQSQHVFNIHSKEELIELLTSTSSALSKQQTDMLLATLHIEDKTAVDIMTLRKHIESIDKKELLGPLVLDDLHKVGYRYLPVVNRNVDHVVGVLEVRNLLHTEDKRSLTVEKVMQHQIYFVHKTDSLLQVIATFLHTGAPLIIVVDESKKTVGLITLQDIIEALLGKVPTDEFQSHDDLQAVASRPDKVQ